MAYTAIIAKNQTAGDLPLKGLSAVNGVIPASGQSELTLYNRVMDIVESPEILAYINSDDLLLTVDGVDLTKAQSLVFLNRPVLPVLDNFTATTNPTATDDADAGYSVGSVWVNTSAGFKWVCEDATATAAVWAGASLLSKTLTGWDGVTSVDNALTALATTAEQLGGTGRFTPLTQAISQTGLNEMTYLGGTGIILYPNFRKTVTWTGGTINTTGYTEGTYYIYVNSSGTVLVSAVDTEPNREQNIHLGLFYHGGTQIGTFRGSGCVLDSALTGVDSFFRALGIFIYDNSGLVTLMSGETVRIVSSSTNIQVQFIQQALTTRDSDDAGTAFLSYYNSADEAWGRDFYWESAWGYNGDIPTDRWNDIGANAAVAASDDCTFTNGSSAVTSATDLTSEIAVGDFISLDDDLVSGQTVFMMPVTVISWSGSQTDITLAGNYQGTGGTGGATINKSLPLLPDGKWSKHLIARAPDDRLYLIPSQTYFDSEADALAAGSPLIPGALQSSIIRMAHVITVKGETDLTGSLFDARPLPFAFAIGGQSGGGSSGGDVIGPGSATNNALVRYDGATGKLIKSTTGWLLGDTGILSGATGGLVLPQAVTPSVSTEGQIAWDTDSDFLVIYDGADTLTFGSLSNTDPQTLGTAAPGTATTAARIDHVHAHGDLLGGTLHADATNLLDGFMPLTDKAWANHAFDSGWAEGGALTYGTGLVINVAAGDGFLNDDTVETTGTTKVTWTGTTVTATANVTGWVYVTSGGTVSYSTTEPDFETNIILGTVQANATVLTMISNARPANLNQLNGNLGEFIEQVFGGIAVSGLVATQNATPLHIDVTAGTYFIAGRERTATTGTNITWTYWYRNGTGGWITVKNAAAISTTNYDSGTGTLTAIPTNRWKKDLVFICENGSGKEYHVVYAQTTFTTQSQARTGPQPVPPTALIRYAAKFADIVVQQGGTTITEITDARPKLGQNDNTAPTSTRFGTVWIPIQSSSSLSSSSYGRQIVVSVAANGGANITFAIPVEATTVISAKLVGIPSASAAGPGKNIDFWTDYGTLGETPTSSQQSDLVSTYDLTGTTGLITAVKELLPLLTSATGGDIVGLEVKHNAIGGAIEYMGVQLLYEVTG